MTGPSVLAHTPAAARPALAALFALDRTLGQVLRTTREPIVGQMRLAWWREALTALDRAPPAAEPVLAALAADVLPRGVDGTALAAMVDGWETLFADPLDDDALAIFARARGGGLFLAAAAVLGGDGNMTAIAGEGWALADLGRHLRDPVVAGSSWALARQRLDAALEHRWPVAIRPLGMMALLAKAGLDDRAPGAPRLLWYRLTGR